MEELRFTGLHEDGTHLVVTDERGAEFAVPLDDRLQAALRRQRADTGRAAAPITPRQVQSMIRAGDSSEEISERTGWDAERVQRYEGPILAEREHVARLARSAHVRTHDRTAPPPTLESRVEQRLAARGVDLDRVRWDSTRPEGGQWGVVVTFVAGHRSRQASWRFDPPARSLDALDDEARWLSEDEQSLPRDVTAETVFGGAGETSDDLMSSMRERSRKRGRSRRPRPGREGESGPAVQDVQMPQLGSGQIETVPTQDGDSTSPVSVPGGQAVPDEALPLEDFPYDPETMGLPPSAHGHAEPADDGPREATLEDFFGDFVHGNGDDEDVGDEDMDEENGQDEDVDAEGADDDIEKQLASAAPPTTASEDAGYAGAQTAPAPAAEADTPSDDDESASARRRRPSVPSWDDIMFGARDRGRGRAGG